MTRNLTVEEILRGMGRGRTQTVGHMSVIPLIDEGDAQDDDFAPPDFHVETSNYGTVQVRNTDSTRPSIVPTGAGWVTRERAQDHAVPSAFLVKANGRKSIETAMCIEDSQGGYIRDQKAITMLVLPASIRSHALSMRHRQGYDKIWPHIRSLNKESGVPHTGGHLTYFLKHFEKQLDEFVAEFELVPKQIGAIILLGENVVGVERAPNMAFWERVWEPLIRVCYGSLAIQYQKRHRQASKFFVPMSVEVKSLAGIHRALKNANAQVKLLSEKTIEHVTQQPLLSEGAADSRLPKMSVATVANQQLAGQILYKERQGYPYVSLCSAGA